MIDMKDPEETQNLNLSVAPVAIGTLAPLLLFAMFLVQAETSVYALAMLVCLVTSVSSAIALLRQSSKIKDVHHRSCLWALSLINGAIAMLGILSFSGLGSIFVR